MLPDPQSSRVVLIGTSFYKNYPDLPAVRNNIEQLSALLQDRQVLGIPPEYCEVVSNPTIVDDLVDPIVEAAEAATDLLLVYFAGHGFWHHSTSDLYLGLVGSKKGLMHKSVNYDYVREALQATSAKRVIVILDCCHSGLALNHMGDEDETGPLADHARVTGTCLLVATAENKKARAGDDVTAFSGELIKLIRDGIPEQGPYLTVSALFGAARTSLEEQGLPRPQIRERDYGASLTLFKNLAYAAANKKEVYGDTALRKAGPIYLDRRALHDDGVHRPLQAGICGTVAKGGAESIVVSGGYKDDRDYGDIIIYTGHGGRDPETGAQVRDQTLADSGNAALVKSLVSQLPVRVVRGAGGNPEYAPESGYRYDGLYYVKDAWRKPGEDGPWVWQFRLERDGGVSWLSDRDHRSSESDSGHWQHFGFGQYSDRLLAHELQVIYKFECQICGETLFGPGKIPFASTVHIRGLGIPHRGTDSHGNMLCLCLNHAALFRSGAITVDDKFTAIDESDGEEIGPIKVKHYIDPENLIYHRSLHHIIHPSP
ncbi:YDG/SRA domain-containing protein [Spirillospora sp. NPDC049652]